MRHIALHAGEMEIFGEEKLLLAKLLHHSLVDAGVFLPIRRAHPDSLDAVGLRDDAVEILAPLRAIQGKHLVGTDYKYNVRRLKLIDVILQRVALRVCLRRGGYVCNHKEVVSVEVAIIFCTKHQRIRHRIANQQDALLGGVERDVLPVPEISKSVTLRHTFRQSGRIMVLVPKKSGNTSQYRYYQRYKENIFHSMLV